MFKEYFEKCRIERIEKTIVDLLEELAVPKNLLGYEYLKTAIFLVTEDFDTIDAMTKIIYPSVAKQHNTLPSRVAEIGIEHIYVASIPRRGNSPGYG